LTSGTVTSANLTAGRLPDRAFHQFAPVDTPAAVARFLEHWRPDAGLFVDSEIWPNTLIGAHSRGVRLAIVNGRMSEKSFAGWRKAKRMAAALLSLYDICLVQDDESAARLRALGAKNVRVTGNLKADAPDLPADPTELNALQLAIEDRPVVLAASTHPGEEEIVVEAHALLRRHYPALLTIIAPRHAERGGEIAKLGGARSFKRRSQGEQPDRTTEIYLADTMGELGLFYRLAHLSFVGGSLVPHGGQNPMEAARLGSAVLAGPYTDNFRSAYEAIFAAQRAGRVVSAAEIANLVARSFGNPVEMRRMTEAAAGAVAVLGGAVERTRAAVEAMLSPNART